MSKWVEGQELFIKELQLERDCLINERRGIEKMIRVKDERIAQGIELLKEFRDMEAV